MSCIQIEAGGKWCAFPCQGDATMTCRAPIHPQRMGNGSTWQLLSGEGQPVTLSPSIDCKECGFHGHIRDGQIETITPGSQAKLAARMAEAFGEHDL